jgi:phage gpG-like protein
VIYAGIHHFGGMAGRGHRSRIDPRPALGLSADDQMEVLDTVNGFLAKKWQPR